MVGETKDAATRGTDPAFPLTGQHAGDHVGSGDSETMPSQAVVTAGLAVTWYRRQYGEGARVA